MIQKILCFFVITFFALLQSSRAEDSFAIDHVNIFFESPRGCIDSSIIFEEFNNYFQKATPGVAYAVTFVSDKTARDWLVEKKTGEKAKNLQILSIGYRRDLSKNFSEREFEGIVKSQTSGFEKNKDNDGIKYIGSDSGKNYVVWTINIFNKNNSVNSTTSTALVHVRNKIVYIFSCASFQDEQKRDAQLEWSKKTCKEAIEVILEKNL